MRFSTHQIKVGLTKQHGAALILMTFILMLGVASYVLKIANVSTVQQDRDMKTYQTLGEAKAALISWSVNHKYYPGQMPWPDRNSDGDYDGSSDCVNGTFQYSYMLGQLPYMPTTAPCIDHNTGSKVYTGLSTYPGLGQEFKDSNGNRFWYAVSRNLVYDYENSENPIINPGMINSPWNVYPYLRQSGTTAYPWLKVYDNNHNLISDRVAVVILAPGEAVTKNSGTTQARTSTANASEFLDSFTYGGTTYSNQDSALADEDFFNGAGNTSASFNDKLIYITIDELMEALEKRVGEQVKASLKSYYTTNTYYPWAAQLGTSSNFACEITTNGGTVGPTSGFLPVHNQSCTYSRSDNPSNDLLDTSNFTCVNPIYSTTNSGITSVRFTRSGGSNITSASGSCTRTNTRCTCTGTGTCSNASGLSVSCASTATTVCTATGPGSLGPWRVTGGKFRRRTGDCAQTTFPTKTNSCSNSNSVITCTNSTGTGTFSSCGDTEFASSLPSWFEANYWQSYVYYHMTRPADASGLTIGSKAAQAMVITTGRPINSSPFASKGSAQTRPSCSAVNNYMDSDEGTDADAVYDAVGTETSTNYNDQMFIVTP